MSIGLSAMRVRRLSATPTERCGEISESRGHLLRAMRLRRPVDGHEARAEVVHVVGATRRRGFVLLVVDRHAAANRPEAGPGGGTGAGAQVAPMA